MQIDSDEISEFVRAVLTGIDKGIPEDSAVSTSVKFQIGLKSQADKQGNVRLMIVGIGGGAGASRSSEEVARIEFEVDDVISVVMKKFDEWGKTTLGKQFVDYLRSQPAKVADG